MSVKAYLTAAEYLKGTTLPTTRPSNAAPVAKDEGFSKLLAAVSPKSEAPTVESAKPAGMTAADYLVRPVRALRPEPAAQDRPLSQAPPRAVTVETMAAPPEKTASPPAHEPSGPSPLISRLRAKPGPLSQAREIVPNGDSALRQKIDHSVTKAAGKYDLPASLIHGVIKAESDFQPRAVSPDGAQGLMQLMPGTARDLGVRNPFDIEQNIDGGARYLRQMLDMFDGNLKKALAAYNAGPATVQRHNGIPPYAETRDYVQKVIALAKDRG